MPLSSAVGFLLIRTMVRVELFFLTLSPCYVLTLYQDLLQLLFDKKVLIGANKNFSPLVNSSCEVGWAFIRAHGRARVKASCSPTCSQSMGSHTKQKHVRTSDAFHIVCYLVIRHTWHSPGDYIFQGEIDSTVVYQLSFMEVCLPLLIFSLRCPLYASQEPFLMVSWKMVGNHCITALDSHPPVLQMWEMHIAL